MQSWIAPVFTLLLSLTSWTDANAEFPSKPVTILVPFGAGSGTDVVTRVIAEPLGSALKQSIVVEDKPGANGAIAAMQVARSVPDGHTLFVANGPSDDLSVVDTRSGREIARVVVGTGPWGVAVVAEPKVKNVASR